MRLVIGSALLVRAGFKLWIDPPLTPTILAVLSIAAGILLIAGLWTPIVGSFVALIEVWKMIMLPGDKMGVAFVRNHWRRARNVRPGFMVHRRSSFWMEAHRNSTAQDEL
jgi:hypothetical protein